MRVLLDENIDRLLKALFAAEFLSISMRQFGCLSLMHLA